jgi:hypothetical protein
MMEHRSQSFSEFNQLYFRDIVTYVALCPFPSSYKILSVNYSSMPNTIDHNCLHLFIDHVHDTVITDTQPISVLTFQLF